MAQPSTRNTFQSTPSESETLVSNNSFPNSTEIASLPTIPASQPASGTQPEQTQESDAKSDASFDPLFDDEPDADGEPDSGNNSVAHSQPPESSNYGGGPDLVPYLAPNQQPAPRSTLGLIAPPKNAPPLLDSDKYATFSSDLLMTASIDGQVILWDKRVNTPGTGVGRLWMSEKTPPWCLSVRFFLVTAIYQFIFFVLRHAGLLMVRRSTRVDETVPSMFGTFVTLVALVLAVLRSS